VEGPKAQLPNCVEVANAVGVGRDDGTRRRRRGREKGRRWVLLYTA
jgi:hypothetical protein